MSEDGERRSRIASSQRKESPRIKSSAVINPELRGRNNDYVAWTGDMKCLYRSKS